MTLIGIDHVQIAAPAGCETAARSFYGELLGLSEIPKPEKLRANGGVWFVCGAQELHVGVEASFAPALKAHPSFTTAGEANLVALAAALEAAGSPVKWDDAIPGVRRFYTADPFGNRLEIRAGGSSIPPSSSF